MKRLLAAVLVLATIPFFFTAEAIAKSHTPLSEDINPYEESRLPPFSNPVTHDEIRLAHYLYSSPAIVYKLNENDSAQWNNIMSKVASGDTEWIQTTALYLRPGTDAGSSTDVLISMAKALETNPTTVLSYAHFLDIERICALPFVEPEYDFIASYGAKTLAALEAVNKPYLTDVRDVCAARLKKGLEHCEKVYKAGHWEY